MSGKIGEGDGRRATGLYNEGCAHFQRGSFAEGVKLLKKALEIDPDMGLAHIALGIAYDKKDMNGDAIQEFTKALYAPYSWRALRKIFRKLVRTARKSGSYLEALRNFDYLISLSHVHQKCFGRKHLDERGFTGNDAHRAEVSLREILAKNSLFGYTLKNSGFAEVDTLLSANDYKILEKILSRLGRPKDAMMHLTLYDI